MLYGPVRLVASMLSSLLVLAILGGCVPADRCLLARLIDRYTRDSSAGAELLRHLTPAGSPCLGGCGNDPLNDTFAPAIQKLRPVLAKRLRDGDQEAWHIAIALREFTDGGLLEDVTATAASGVSSRPSEYLRAARARPHSGALHVVGFLGEEFVDTPSSVRCKELKARLTSLAAVSDADLAALRDQSVQELRRMVQPCR